MRAGAHEPEGHYSLVHSHYWLSGQVGWLAADRWQVPLVHTMHTMAKVKNLHLADGDTPEPAGREIGEQQVVEAADRIIANTLGEAHELVDLYAAEPDKVVVVPPGRGPVAVLAGGPARGARRGGAAAGRQGAAVRRPDPAAQGPRGAGQGRRRAARPQPRLARRSSSSPSSGARAAPGWPTRDALQELAEGLGISAQVRFVPPVPRAELRSGTAPPTSSRSPPTRESFGLVAVEAQACGTPVVAADVGGLPTAVGDAGVLVDGHDPHVWAQTLEQLLVDHDRRKSLSDKAVEHAALFGWDRTTERLIEVYVEACRAEGRQGANGSPSPNGSLVGIPSAVVP